MSEAMPQPWVLLPVDTSHGECAACGRVHPAEMPHDQQSLYWQYHFYAEHARWPSWRDAMAHCTEEVQSRWTEALRELGIEACR